MSQFNLQPYLNIAATINELEHLKQQTRNMMYNQTLVTHVAYDETDIHVKAPKIEQIVSDNILACEHIQARIQRLRDKERYFDIFLTTLSEIERESLFNGTASELLQEQALDEIYEIETAICFKYGYPPLPIKNQEIINDLDKMLGAFAV